VAVPTLEPVQSSNIAAVGHDGKGGLFVKFHTGAIWKYHDVSPAIYAEMKGSGSIGKYHRQFVLPNHRGEKVEASAEVPKDGDVTA
jgi:hypothetical protein